MAKTIWVSPAAGRWNVHFEKEPALKTFDNKANAISYAKEVVKGQPEGQVTSIRVQDAQGVIQTEWTYGRDPFPPRG